MSKDKEACRTCVYYDNPAYHLGNCRRHAPTTEDRGKNVIPRYVKNWPKVSSCDWCGDHESR